MVLGVQLLTKPLGLLLIPAGDDDLAAAGLIVQHNPVPRVSTHGTSARGC